VANETSGSGALAPADGPPELKNTGYELFIASLSILSLINIVLRYAVHDENLDQVLLIINVLLSTIFLADFTYRLCTAASKSNYVFREFGWADLLASLPFEQLKILRVFRLIRVVRLLRENGLKKIGAGLIADRAGSALFTLLLMGILVLEFGSLEVLHLEQHAAGSNIATGGDALWYVMVTISTVGYGDRYPVTGAGRTAGAIVILLGVAIFGTFTGYLANLFLAPPDHPTPGPEVAHEGTDPQATLQALRDLLVQQQDAIDELARVLDAGGQTRNPPAPE